MQKCMRRARGLQQRMQQQQQQELQQKQQEEEKEQKQPLRYLLLAAVVYVCVCAPGAPHTGRGNMHFALKNNDHYCCKLLGGLNVRLA